MRIPAASASGAMVRACWRTRSSVGAMIAACAPLSIDGGGGEERDHGLARADVALEQAEHALGFRKVGVDLGQRLHLAAGRA